MKKIGGRPIFLKLHLRYLNIGETEKCYCSKYFFSLYHFSKPRHVYDFCGKYEKTGSDITSSNYSQGYASAALWSSKFGIFLQSCLTEVRDQRKKVMMIGVIKNYKRFIFNFYYDCILVRLI